ncbi:hypothetical protein [Agrobacterium sp. OT33]|uniref:hypothetical protein n=1 Tax=Agrobacterium sp. OT33 TaxID=2815338 RepID=UPI001A8EB599|nr:hypothetical protein [Agrobacterium sp. OT33]MBO0128364.1 hypothetical protein [Agrobacterium sp. OT33]
MSSLQTTTMAVAPQNNRLYQLSLTGDRAQRGLTARFLAARPFENRRHYARFLIAQHRIARELRGVYLHPSCPDIFPSQEIGGHISRIEKDLRDLDAGNVESRPGQQSPRAIVDVPGLCGGLFVTEGVRLAFPFFRKQAEHLGLNAFFGARHLAYEASDIRRRWTGFAETINKIAFSTSDMRRMTEAARQVMELIGTILDEEMNGNCVARKDMNHD